MNDVIESHPQDRGGQRLAGWLGLGLLILMVTVGSIWAALAWNSLEPALQVFVGGVISLALLLASGLLIIIRAGDRDDKRAARRDSLYSDAFFLSGRPQLITRNGKPAHANKAYLDVASTLNVDVLSGALPGLDRLFSATGKEGSAAIFRLHHLEPHVRSAEEDINLVLPDGRLSRFRVSVKRLNDKADLQLWQVDEIAGFDESDNSLSQAPIGLFSITREGQVISINPTMQRWLGGSEAIAPGHVNEFIEDPVMLLESEAVHGKTVRADTRLVTRKGVVTPIVMIARWTALDNGKLIASVALHGHTSRPSGNRRPAEAAKPPSGKVQEQASAFASVPFGVLHIDGSDIQTAKVSYSNKGFRQLWGGKDPAGQPFLSLFSGSILASALNGASPADMADMGAIDVRLSGDDKVPVALYLVPDPVLPERLWAYLVDISARKSLEDQVRQSQKMQAIGQLTAGVAHDFNNLLTAIRLNTDELLQRHPVGDPSYPELQNINATGARAAALVKKLLAFSRQQTRRAERIDVSEALSDMYLTLKQTLGGQAQL